ncbi:hypothetical protein [Pararhizobium arenae]|uniref:hypothetical protein n=1 Tax=Pararhizobium arenae TaxID=1856850 RepID=UPI00094B5EA6|nr:hypothetical protein [Pararhizobium arenae]
MQNEPQFAIGDFRRSKDCQDQMDALLSNAVDIMVMRGWETAEVLEAAELALKATWKSADADPDLQDAPDEAEVKPYPDAPRAG